MEYKSFKDIKIGDYLYSCNKNINKIYRFPVTNIIKDEFKVQFYFSELPWDYISVLLKDLNFSKTDSGIFVDINLLFNYINENT